MEHLPSVEYFDVTLAEGVVQLKPIQVYDTDIKAIRSKIKKLGLTPNSVKEAVKWARSK